MEHLRVGCVKEISKAENCSGHYYRARLRPTSLAQPLPCPCFLLTPALALPQSSPYPGKPCRDRAKTGSRQGNVKGGTTCIVLHPVFLYSTAPTCHGIVIPVTSFIVSFFCLKSCILTSCKLFPCQTPEKPELLLAAKLALGTGTGLGCQK